MAFGALNRYFVEPWNSNDYLTVILTVAHKISKNSLVVGILLTSQRIESDCLVMNEVENTQT